MYIKCKGFICTTLFTYVFFMSSSVLAKDFYIDPVNGSDNNSGSQASPWRSLQHLFQEGKIETRNWNTPSYNDNAILIPKNSGAPVKPGDTIYLMSGNYGTLTISRHYNTDDIFITALAGHTPRFNYIYIYAASQWVLDGLQVTPEWTSTPNCYNNASKGKSPIICIESHNYFGPSRDITLKNSHIRSVANIDGFSPDDWVEQTRAGMTIRFAERVKVEGNTFLNVAGGASLHASPRAEFNNNRIVNFSGDGIRIIGAHHSVVEGNMIKNAYLGRSTQSFHYDGIQHWSTNENGQASATAITEGVKLKNNTIIAYENPNTPNLVKQNLQGIGAFDGRMNNWEITNNTVIVDHWHGITLNGISNSVVTNNLISNLNDASNRGSTMRISPSKRGSPATNVVVRCNISEKISIDRSGINITSENNSLVNLGSQWASNADDNWHPNCSNVQSCQVISQ